MFLVNVPIGIIALIVISRVLHLPPLKKVQHRIDWPGALLLIVTLVPILLVAEQGREWGWASGYALTCYVIGVLGLVGFIFAERFAKGDAILPLYLFHNRTFSVGAAANTVIGLGMFGGLATLPLYLQIVKGQTPTHAGLTLIPFTLGIMAGSIIAGQTTSRTGRYKALPVFGTVLMASGAFMFSRLQTDTSLNFIFACSIVFGLGLGFTMQPLVLAVQNAVPVRDMGVATSSSLFFRQMGGTLGTAVFLSILFSTVGDNIKAAFTTAVKTPAFQQALADPAVQANPANAPVLDLVKNAGGTLPSLNDSSFINNLDARLAKPFLDGFSQSIDTVLLVATCIIAVGIVLTALLPELPLRNISGIQGRLDADAADADAAGASSGAPAGAAGATAAGGVAAIVADQAAVERADAEATQGSRTS